VSHLNAAADSHWPPQPTTPLLYAHHSTSSRPADA
jgi:hypothetical protein